LSRELDSPELFPRVGRFYANVPAPVRFPFADPDHAENFIFLRKSIRHAEGAAILSGVDVRSSAPNRLTTIASAVSSTCCHLLQRLALGSIDETAQA